MADGFASRPTLDKERSRKVGRFFFKTTVQIVWWDIFLNRPGLQVFRPPPIPRWQATARDFRRMAVEMGGVLIKLGQFLASRADLLPREVIDELRSLNDEVPPEPFAEIARQIEIDQGRPVEDIFEWIDHKPVGSASLAQAHRARLSGQSVVIKVLRPNIKIEVETDLRSVGKLIRRLKNYKRVARNMNLEWLVREFSTVTRAELDCQHEGRNCERFAKDFANDPRIYVPKIHWAASGRSTLTMEDVGYIRIDNTKALDNAGIDRSEVGKCLFRTYLTQFFVTNFVHADPHAGNLFVKPLPVESDGRPGGFEPGKAVPHAKARPFQLVFVDFGMSVDVPPRLRRALRSYAIGVGTRDARKIVQAYQEGGLLLPNADIERLIGVTDALLDRFWPSLLGQMQGVDLAEYGKLFTQDYSEMLYESPIQFPADLLFVFRAMGMLSGISARLDPNMDMISEVKPFTNMLAREELKATWKEWTMKAPKLLEVLMNLPFQVEDILKQRQEGRLTSRVALARDTERNLGRLTSSVNRLRWTIVSMGLLGAGAVWYGKDGRAADGPVAGLILAAILVFVGGSFTDK